MFSVLVSPGQRTSICLFDTQVILRRVFRCAIDVEAVVLVLRILLERYHTLRPKTLTNYVAHGGLPVERLFGL